MKQNATTRRILSWLTQMVGCAAICLTFAVPARASVLIIEVSDADEQPALRLADLLDMPVQRRRVPQAAEPSHAVALLAHDDADQAVVLDSEGRRVHVVTRGGVIKTRVVEGDPPAAYVMAFVAAELLELRQDEPRSDMTIAPEPVPRLLHVAGRLGLATAAPYVGHSLLRAQLGAELWLASARQQRYLAIIGLTLDTPGQLRQQRAPRDLELTRWDVRLRAGLMIRLEKLHILLFGQPRIATARVQSAAEPSRSFVSAGFGLGAALQIPATHWLSFYVEGGPDFMGRRARYRVAGDVRLHERAVPWGGSLGVVVHTPWAER